MAFFTGNGKNFGWAAAFVALVVSAAAISSGAAAPTDERTGVRAALEKAPIRAPAADGEDVAERFADAPYGVDPVVTGPVSASFRKQREAAGCDKAVWPNVPASCYPD
ncbi:hypothetical protein RB623_00870 [Mesorhizobium sp. LHD-90]|uniref:hypothetical protein n=1 Tax=Mesorhizobium sp. LHD-90 TaxID=3071414 RepID=UPI0027E1C8F5|nr:hypothetical protein [Mesorhizobium sp. LHD-90]MDQ6432601.1 hypothetical protein [Mesorhizobium sp. LHD-90]